MKKKTIFIILLILLLSILVFKNLKLGYYLDNNIYDEGKISLGVPKLSFMKKVNEKNYSYKNIRNKNILKKEVTDYLNSLDKIKCNNTTYYFDKKNNFTIIDYSIKNYILYNNISYDVRYGNYCFNKLVNEYAKKLGGIKRYHTLGGKFSLSPDKEFTPMLRISFLSDVDMKKEKFEATMKVEYLTPIPNVWDRVSRKEIEESSGIYEIKDNKLYYTRTNFEKKSDDTYIPETSVFEIQNENLILIDNYLDDYSKNITLK